MIFTHFQYSERVQERVRKAKVSETFKLLHHLHWVEFTVELEKKDTDMASILRISSIEWTGS